MTQNNQPLSEKEERIKLEAKLLEQEHRPLKLILNYIRRNEYWKDQSDIRRKAVKKAILWRLLISPTTIAIATGGLLGYISIFFLWKQNTLLENQNLKIEQQTYLIEADRRASQVFIMGEVLSDLNIELENKENIKRVISKTLTGRIISLSRAMKPYRYLNNDSLIKNRISPERGQLLISLIESNIDSTYLIDNIIKKCDFTFSDLNRANLDNSSFNGVNLSYSDFSASSLNNTDFKGSNLTKSNFRGAKLKKANFSNVILNNSDLRGLKVNDSDFSKSSILSSDLRLASFHNTDFNNSKLDDSKLRFTFFTHSNLSHCSLNNINFESSELSFVDLSHSKIFEANFENIRWLDNLKVHRSDWLTYIKDSLKIKGSKKLLDSHIIMVFDNKKGGVIFNKTTINTNSSGFEKLNKSGN